MAGRRVPKIPTCRLYILDSNITSIKKSYIKKSYIEQN